MTNEEKLNKELTKIYESFERTLPYKSGQFIRTVDKTRLTVADILGKHAGTDGKIPKERTNKVITEVGSVEGEIYRNMRDELRAIVNSSAAQVTTLIAEAVIAVIGASAFLKLLGIGADIAEAGVDIVAFIFNARTGYSYAGYADAVVDSLFNRVGSDGKKMNDRLRLLSKTLRSNISKTLRQSIHKGEVTSEALRKVKRKIAESANHFKTIIETECLNAVRQAKAWFAEKSGIVSALKIVDYPHGTVHARHKCYEYAHADEHGLGKGIYPVTTVKIRHPHPRCRSTLHFKLKKEFN